MVGYLLFTCSVKSKRLRDGYILVCMPCVLFQCVVIFLAKSYAPAYYGDYTFPGYAVNIGWVIAILPTVGIIPVIMLFQFFWNMDFLVIFNVCADHKITTVKISFSNN